jgi:HSP20 family molecular chaperone IbpA
MITIKIKRFQQADIELDAHDVIEFDLSGKRGDKIRVSVREGQLYINGDDVIIITPSASNCISLVTK